MKIEYIELTPEEFAHKMTTYSANLDELFSKGKELENSIKKQMEGLRYESN